MNASSVVQTRAEASSTATRGNASKLAQTTLRSASISGQDDPEWLLAVIESRSREVGVVAIEREFGHVFVTQFSDSPTYVKVIHFCNLRPPSLVVVPSSALSSNPSVRVAPKGTQVQNNAGIQTVDEESTLVRALRDSFPGLPIQGILRKCWDEQAGFEFLTQLVVHDDQRHGTVLAARSKYYALAAISALFKYLENTHSIVFAPRSLRIRYSAIEGTCLIDTETAANLELVTNLVNKHSKQNLLGMMSTCLTPMGHRLLRSNLLSPLTDVEVIDARLDAVEEIVNSEERLTSICKALQSVKSIDMDKLVGYFALSNPSIRRTKTTTNIPDPAHEAEIKIGRLLSLRSILAALPALRDALRHADSSLLRSIDAILRDPALDLMLEEINSTLNDDAVGREKGTLNLRNARIYAVQAKKKKLLDVARETYKEALNDAFERTEVLKKEHDLDMSLQYVSGSFLYTCTRSEWEAKKSPKNFINVSFKGKRVEFSTIELRSQSTKIAETVQEIFFLSDEVVVEIFEKLLRGISAAYRCSEAIAMLDMVASFSLLSSNTEYVRPEFTETVAIKAGRNPLHEYFRLSDGTFVPNDTYANEAASFQLVTGCNMSGKSTLLRQVALLHVMAQAGCFVPASYASFRIIDALLSRLSNDDSIEAGLSTFSKEMSAMSLILSALPTFRHSLVVIDELGRGTSPEEGIGIAHALAEAIMETKALCFFATHFKELTLSLARCPNVVSLHLEAEIDRDQPDFSLTLHHRVTDGANTLIHYGLELAKLAKLPSDVLQNATSVAVTLASLAEAGQERAQGVKLARRRRELLQVKASLKMLSKSNAVSGRELVGYLRQLQVETIENLSGLMKQDE